MDEQGLQQGVGAGVAEAQSGDAGAGVGDDRRGEVGECLGAADRVVVQALDAEQAPVGGEADLPQGGQVGQPFGQPEVAGVVDRGLGAQRPAFLVVLLDLGVFVVDVQGRDDPVGDDSGAEPAGGFAAPRADDAPVEDQADLVGAADVEVV